MHYLIAKWKELSPVQSPWSYSCNCHCLFFKFFPSTIFSSGYPPASLPANFQLFPLVCMCMLSRFTCVWILVTVWTVTCQALLSMGILQARILEWVAMPSSRGSSQHSDWTHISYVSCVGRGVLSPGKLFPLFTSLCISSLQMLESLVLL